jgi:peptidoglycan hydrolase-like protein with peptidoglycan-binding domain
MAKTYTGTDIQKRLVALGYDIGPSGADGDLGNDTKKAVAKYEHDHGLSVTGNPLNPKLLASLFPESSIIQNATNSEPWYNSRIYRGIIISTLGVVVTFIPALHNSGVDVGSTVNEVLDAVGPVMNVVGLLYAAYGRIVGAKKPPLGG